MSARTAAELSEQQRNDRERVAAIVREDSAVKRLQAIQRVLMSIPVGSPGIVAVLARQIAEAGGLYFEPQG